MQSFGPVAPHYDELMKTVPYRMWVGYYMLLLAHQDVHPKRVLDVCCGTGSMCDLLTREGMQMTGFDISGGMIEVARKKAEKARQDIQYFMADACDFDLGQKFDAAFSFFDSLNNITEPSRLQSALNHVAMHLEPGGSFIFDLNTAFAFEAKLFDQQNLRANAKLRYKWEGEYDPETKIIKVDMTFWQGDREFKEIHVQRAYSDDEVRCMLGEAGFYDVRGFTSYTLNPIRARSDRVHYMCLKEP